MKEPVNSEFRNTSAEKMLRMMAKLVPAANDNTGGDKQRAYAQNRFYWPSPIY